MPPIRNSNPAAPAERGQNDSVSQQYDVFLAQFAPGEHGQVELGANDERANVRNQLQAAAQRRGLVLSFRRGRGPLIFRVESRPGTPASAPAAGAQRPVEVAAIEAAPPAAELPPPPAVELPVPAQRPLRRVKRAPAAAQPVNPPPASAATQQMNPPPAAVQSANVPSAPAERPVNTPPAPAQRPAQTPPRRSSPPQGPPQRSGPPADQRSSRPPAARANSRRPAEPRRQNDDRRSAGNSRYDDMLPRWMREGERPAGNANRRRNDGKRRTRS